MTRKKIQLLLPLLGGLLGGLLLDLYLQYSEQGELAFSPELLREAAASAVLGIVAGAGMYVLYRFLNRVLPWQENLGARFFGTFLGFVTLSLTLAWAGDQAYRFLLSGSDFQTAPFKWTDPLLKLVIVVVLAGFVYTVVEFALYSYHRYAQLQIESVKQEQARLALQYDLLQSQLSPHYLFNGLNTISSLIYTDADLAAQYIRNFAHTYQYLLRASTQPMVKLQEELEFMRTYVFLLQVRFGGHLNLEVNLPEPFLASSLPPLTLQLLVENAVKHNLVSPETPLHIRIYPGHDDYLCVINTIAPKAEQPTSHQLGLSNIIQRYGYFTAKPVLIEQGEQFEVKLPLLNAPFPETNALTGYASRSVVIEAEKQVSRDFQFASA